MVSSAAQIQGALAAYEFEPFFQPIIDLLDFSLVGFEALARWRHPRRGVVEPGEFVSVAEESGLIRAIDSAILDGSWQAIEAALEATPDFAHPLQLSVNLSATHLIDMSVVDRMAPLVEAGLGRRWKLQFELTETLRITDLDLAVGILNELRALGISIALDDFGTGYSGLAYLHRLPIDCIKIDRSFLKSVTHSPRGRAIIRSMVNLAQSIGVSAVAEGVETERTAEALRGLGCRYAQGLYFSAPIPGDDLPRYLERMSVGRA
jgi:EAL domain-containing protein (putative c-di-GMP-specific phosphodiesterase class I)